jgi:hypothetical protein
LTVNPVAVATGVENVGVSAVPTGVIAADAPEPLPVPMALTAATLK